MKSLHVLVVDDDPAIRETIEDFLSEYDFQVSTAGDGAGLFEVLERGRCDLVVLDLKLPGEDGLSLAARLRSSYDIPIIMLTSLGSDVDRIVGLEMGADDYLAKPFNPRELLARIRAVLRRVRGLSIKPTPETRHQRVHFAGWTLDLTVRDLLSPQGERVDLTAGEFNLLEAFIKAPRRILSRDQLLEMTHSTDAEVFDRTIDVLILRLRRKIEPDPRHPSLIRTERGAGYVFAPQVEWG